VIITDAQSRAENIIKDNIDKLHALTNALLEYEILDSDQIDRILKGESLEVKNNKKQTKKGKSASDTKEKPDAKLRKI